MQSVEFQMYCNNILFLKLDGGYVLWAAEAGSQ